MAVARGAGAADVATAHIRVTGLGKTFGETTAVRDVSLTVEEGRTLALLGPSGCGKTTLLRLIAGLERADGGTIEVAARDVTQVPAEQRRIGMVFQDWALFPHLSVARNVAYGLAKGPDRQGRIDEALELVGLAGLAGRMPATLSGGQQQRVAIARAIAPRPGVLLLDEPFSNLDASLRVRVRGELHELLVGLGVTTVFVTHDQEEAFVLGDEVAVMRDGEMVQQATPAHVYHRPVDAWVAGFVGESNIVAGAAAGPQVITPLGTVTPVVPVDGPVDVLLRPEELRLAPVPGDADGPAGDVPAGARREGVGEVELVEFYGKDTLYLVRTGSGARLRVRRSGAPIVGRGDRVSITVSSAPAMVFPAR